MAYQYQAFGLNIHSVFSIPELAPFEGKADVYVRFAEVPDNLDESCKTTLRFQAKPGYFLLKVDKIAKYLVTGGNTITIQMFPDASEEDMRLFLLGSAIGAIIYQRNMYPVHASSIKFNGGVVLFCGASGHGKSTIANALLKKGYGLHTDDVCVVEKNKNGIPHVFPEYPHLKLWQDSLIELGEDPASYSRVRHVVKKFLIPARQTFPLSPLPVKKIYILCPLVIQGITITELSGIHKVKWLQEQTYRKKYISAMGLEEKTFKTAAYIASHVPIALIKRPVKPFLLKPLVDMVVDDLNAAGASPR